jgi:SAM-dependent methyltransferase
MNTKKENFTESDIRPDELITEQQIAVTIDIGRMLIHADKFVKVNCPACDNINASYKFKKYSLTFVECINCKTIYTNPRPTDKVLEDFYKNSVNYDYWNNYIFPASEEARRKNIFVPRVDKTIDFCNKYGVKTESVLEVGAAFGTFCVEIESRSIFKKIVAIEPSPGLAKTLREKGIDVIEEVIEKINFEENDKFDVVVNFEVIEHLFSPRDFIKKCRTFLKVGGLFIVTCPNGKGFDFEVLGDKCNSLDHEHLNYFNPQSLSHLLSNCGFDVLETLTPGRLDAELVRKKILTGEMDLNNQPFLQQILIENWEQVGDKFQNFLADSGLSSNLWIIAKAK